ncbi:MFS transporter [Blastococcus sp. TF02-8]|uniref:MFS transporter n=1 Tax=Blastococcus sp. TF02-8 TaxID=2250574 RepID=UPI000DE98E0F|nr:MFS transporter [Blastococcus sp. TF02-8]RBY93542.1 MFS transporter [Blastococcus sp. TF02-8]
MSTDASGTASSSLRQATFREVFAVREFRPLFGTFLLSAAGDELARVALTVLVYARTDSPLLAALTFAIGYLPWLLGGPLLSVLADRFPRHRVLIATDAARAVVVALMALPGVPLWLLLVLLFLVGLCAPPFESARSALMADVLDGDRYAVATSLTGITVQLAQVGGFLAGGALLLVFSPSTALLVDAATFLVSAVWLWAGLQRRPAPASEIGDQPTTLWRDAVEGLRFIRRTPRLLAIVGVAWLATGFLYAPEGIAAPLVDELGRTQTAVGVLLAANPLGLTISGLVIARLVPPHRRERLVGPLVVASLLAVLAAGLVAVVAAPSPATFWAVVVLLFFSGLAGAWTIPLNVAFVQAVPSAYRGRAFGVAASGLSGIQGLGALVSGVAAEGVGAAVVVAVAGGLGMIAVAPTLVAYRRTRDQVPAAVDVEGASGA